MESSVTRTLTFGIGERHGMHNHGESAVNVLEMNQVGPEIEASKCSDQKNLQEKSDVMVGEHEVCLQSNSVNYNDGSDILEDEVSICFLPRIKTKCGCDNDCYLIYLIAML